MRWFKKMCDVVSVDGLVDMDGSREVLNLDYYKEGEPVECFFSAASHNNPFVFSCTGDKPKDCNDLDRTPENEFEYIELDAPFSVFSIEMLEENTFVCIPREDDDFKVYICCIMVVEVSPKRYCYYALTYIKNYNKYVVNPLKDMGKIIQDFTDRLKTTKVGVEKVKEVIKLGKGKNRYRHVINRVVYVLSKDKINEIGESRKIDWSHRWAVRGHWRKIDGLGKNRAGEYIVSGYTWVSEFEKGPKELPLIKKIRVQKNEVQ